MTEPVIGLMDSAYFVSKAQLLGWINSTLDLDVAFIQDLGAGSIYCQLLDAHFKGVVPMSKVNWRAKFEYQFVSNLKLFQKGLEKVGVTRKFDVNKLSKAKYQDNLQTIQWLKRLIEKSTSPLEAYQPLQRRGGQSFLSPHSQKQAFANKGHKAVKHPPSKVFGSKESILNQENKESKVDSIKRILALNEISEVKLYLIEEVVLGKKEGGLPGEQEKPSLEAESF